MFFARVSECVSECVSSSVWRLLTRILPGCMLRTINGESVSESWRGRVQIECV